MWTRTLPVEWCKSRSSAPLPCLSFSRSKLTHIIISANTSQMVRARANIAMAIKQEDKYFPSHGDNANVVRRVLDIFSRSYNFWISQILYMQTVRTSEKYSSATFKQADTSHAMAPMQIFGDVTLSYIFKLTFLEIIDYLISGKQ